MTSTPGVVRIATNSPNLINALNSLGGAEYVQSNFFLSDSAVAVIPYKTMVFGFNSSIMGICFAFGPDGSDAQIKAAIHELLHQRKYLESKRAEGDIMSAYAIGNGTARVTAQQAADLADLSGATPYHRVYWELKEARQEARRRIAAQQGIGEVTQ